jgi:hypothetical protein
MAHGVVEGCKFSEPEKLRVFGVSSNRPEREQSFEDGVHNRSGDRRVEGLEVAALGALKVV